MHRVPAVSSSVACRCLRSRSRIAGSAASPSSRHTAARGLEELRDDPRPATDPRCRRTPARAAASRNAIAPRACLQARSTATVPGSMSTIRGLAAWLTPPPFPRPDRVRTMPADRRMRAVPASRSISRQRSASTSPRASRVAERPQRVVLGGVPAPSPGTRRAAGRSTGHFRGRRFLRGGRRRRVGGVAHEQAVLHRLAEYPVYDRVQVPDRAGRHTFAGCGPSGRTSQAPGSGWSAPAR